MEAKALGARWCGVWIDLLPNHWCAYSLFTQSGSYLLLSTQTPLNLPNFTTQAIAFPAANRMERHAHDLFGVNFANHPDPRRWTRHQAWPDDWFPLRESRTDTIPQARRTPADSNYPFEQINGSGIIQVPVGPVHAGIIEPGHFRFHVAGEPVLKLEERLGYAHKGIEKLAVGRDAAGLARLASRISGDSAVSHAWAACQAMERATSTKITRRAIFLRGLLAERERVANHLGDIGAICSDVGFAFAHLQFSRLREIWQRRNLEFFGHRLLMDSVIPGGVSFDVNIQQISTLLTEHKKLRRELQTLFDILNDHAGLEDRLVNTGILTIENAQDLGCIGYVGKASGQDIDLRRDAPYGPYDQLKTPVNVLSEGDVSARVRIRMAELPDSLLLMDHLLQSLPDGDPAIRLLPPPKYAQGLGLIEGWRGEVLAFIRFDQRGKIARYFPRDPSWFLWPALERLIHGNIIPDFPVCNKSINGSYSGVDL